MNTENITRITLYLNITAGAAEKIATLVQRGFLLPLSGTVSILDLLTELPGFSEAYIRERVQTIFVNGLAEDDISRLLVAGNTLALSAAMPGLAGAIFRRGGRHATLRTRPMVPKQDKTEQAGYITLKLFNMIATETGPQLLRNGILIKGDVMARFLDKQCERILPIISRVDRNDSPVELGRLIDIVAQEDIFYLKICW